jgi:hypothetical protein
MENTLNLQYFYRGLPMSWASIDRDDFSITSNKLETLVGKFIELKSIDKPVKVYSNNIKVIVKEIFDVIDIQGVDFIKYFENAFNNQGSFTLPTQGKVVVIYNVGLERAVNTQFSSKLLKGLIQQIQESNKHIVVDSHLTYSEFFKQYQIDFVNKIRIPAKPEEAIF